MNVAVLVTGSRAVETRTWQPIVDMELANIYDAYERMIVIHGDCPDPRMPFRVGPEMVSVDQIAKRWALRNAVPQWPFPADWSRGRWAGPERNAEMVRTLVALSEHGGFHPIVLAFHPDLDNSKGTGNCVRCARMRGLAVTHMTENGMMLLLPTKEAQ